MGSAKAIAQVRRPYQLQESHGWVHRQGCSSKAERLVVVTCRFAKQATAQRIRSLLWGLIQDAAQKVGPETASTKQRLIARTTEGALVREQLIGKQICPQTPPRDRGIGENAHQSVPGTPAAGMIRARHQPSTTQ